MHMTVTQMIKAAPVMIIMTTSAAKRAEGAVGYSLIIALDTRSIFKTKLLNLYESASTSRYYCQEAQLSRKIARRCINRNLVKLIQAINDRP